MRFFSFSQSNSGGYLDERPGAGIGDIVCIEAADADDANRRAFEIGMSFGTLGECECCGPRWFEADEFDGMPFPNRYNELIWGASSRDKACYIHYANGTIETVHPGDPAPDRWQQVYLAHIGVPQRKGA
jgi:hypothetical protein